MTLPPALRDSLARDFLIEQFADHQRLESGHSPNTVESYDRDLMRLAQFALRKGVKHPSGLTRTLLRDHVFELKDVGLGGASIRRAVSAIRRHIEELLLLPNIIEHAVRASAPVEKIAERFYNRTDFLFLGRGINYPIALEGALKLKEISYIHAEGYPAGEMKHGPIALIDERMPVVAIAPNDHVFEKMVGNVQEAKARGGSVIAITSDGDPRMSGVLDPVKDVMISMPETTPMLTPIVMTIPLQLLAYHIAVRRGCDVDQPRNLAKSVTVE